MTTIICHNGLIPLRTHTQSSVCLFEKSSAFLQSSILISRLNHHSYNQTRKRFQSTESASSALTQKSPSSSKVNPPESTRPAPLDLPSRQPDQSFFSYYFSLGKATLKFYKNGLKAVYTNSQTSLSIRGRLSPSTSIQDAVKQNLLSRGEYQLLRRSRQDVLKIPLFALLFMICGEFTPLVVVFVSGVVPRTCYIPRQIESQREKAEKRRKESFRMGTVEEEKGVPTTVGDLNKKALLHVGASLGLYRSIWDKIGVSIWPPMPLLRSRVRKEVDYLGLDDMAIERDGGVQGMELDEVKIALEERGLDVLGKNEELLRRSLKEWLGAKEKETVVARLVTRPSSWRAEK